MHILSSLLFAFSANVDNFVVGLSYGIKKIKIGFMSNLLIALISLAGTVLSMLAGKIIFDFMPKNVSNSIGSTMLILIGTWTIVKPLLKNKNSNDILDNPEKADVDNSSSIDGKESIVLAFALTINNVGLGIGASITGLNVVLTSFFTFIFSMIMITAGHICGSNYLSKVFSKSAAIVSGLIIIFLGVYEMLI